jgi:beta-lactamase superfamily II metal-dependent hydrolase
VKIEDEFKCEEKTKMEAIKESVEKLQEKKEKIYLKYYFTDDMYDELFDNVPNDLLNRIGENPSIYELFELMDLVYSSLKDIDGDKKDYDFPFQLHFSLINNWVIEKDQIFKQEYNGENRLHLGYRPYFMEFSGYCTNKEQCRKLLLEMEYGENNYFSGFFIKNTDSQVGIDTKEGCINKHKILAVVRGEVMVSASPIDNIPGMLYIIEDYSKVSPEYEAILNDSIYECKKVPYRESDSLEITKTLDKTIINGKPKILNVYNVGQGNCASIEMENGSFILADIGLTNDKIELSQKYTVIAKRKIRDINPQIIILSHWDLDHILGITNTADSIYDSVWIVPDLWGLKRFVAKKKSGEVNYKYVSDSAKRLLKYLDWRNRDNLLIIDDSFSRKQIYSNTLDSVSIWTGERCDKSGMNIKKKHYMITAANNFGLIIYLRNQYSALLPGDCEYQILPDDLLNKEVNYLVVPHHCSKMSEPNIKEAIYNRKAILSYGIHNKHNHPDMLNMKLLFDKGYEIIPTAESDSIVLHL